MLRIQYAVWTQPGMEPGGFEKDNQASPQFHASPHAGWSHCTSNPDCLMLEGHCSGVLPWRLVNMAMQ